MGLKPPTSPGYPERVMVRALVVDDEAEVGQAIRRGLEVLGFEIETAVDGADRVARVESWRPDVVLLDLAMPNMSGLSALRQIRGWSQVPIIVLSVMGEEADNVRALEAGADDYVTKPFGMQELQARIRVVLRRGAREQSERTLAGRRLSPRRAARLMRDAHV